MPTHDFHKGASSCAMNFQLDPRSIQSTAIPRPCSSGALKYSMGNPSKSEGSNICFAAHASLKINRGRGGKRLGGVPGFSDNKGFGNVWCLTIFLHNMRNLEVKIKIPGQFRGSNFGRFQLFISQDAIK